MNKLMLISILMNIMFLLSGFSKLKDINKVSSGLEKRFPIKTLPFVFFKLTIVLVALLQIIAPLIITLSFTNYLNKYISKSVLKQLGRFSCITLAVFTVLATLLYHFPPEGTHYYPFMSNLTTIGGLLLLAINI